MPGNRRCYNLHTRGFTLISWEKHPKCIISLCHIHLESHREPCSQSPGLICPSPPLPTPAGDLRPPTSGPTLRTAHKGPALKLALRRHFWGTAEAPTGTRGPGGRAITTPSQMTVHQKQTFVRQILRTPPRQREGDSFKLHNSLPKHEAVWRAHAGPGVRARGPRAPSSPASSAQLCSAQVAPPEKAGWGLQGPPRAPGPKPSTSEHRSPI